MSDRSHLAPMGLGIAFAAFGDTLQIARVLNITVAEAFEYQDKARADFDALMAQVARAKKAKP